MIYLNNRQKWDELDLDTQVEEIRKHYCTGPCGQSSSVLEIRGRTNKVLIEIKQKLKELKRLHEYVDKWSPYIESMPFCPD